METKKKKSCAHCPPTGGGSSFSRVSIDPAGRTARNTAPRKTPAPEHESSRVSRCEMHPHGYCFPKSVPRKNPSPRGRVPRIECRPFKKIIIIRCAIASICGIPPFPRCRVPRNCSTNTVFFSSSKETQSRDRRVPLNRRDWHRVERAGRHLVEADVKKRAFHLAAVQRRRSLDHFVIAPRQLGPGRHQSDGRRLNHRARLIVDRRRRGKTPPMASTARRRQWRPRGEWLARVRRARRATSPALYLPARHGRGARKNGDSVSAFISRTPDRIASIFRRREMLGGERRSNGRNSVGVPTRGRSLRSRCFSPRSASGARAAPKSP